MDKESAKLEKVSHNSDSRTTRMETKPEFTNNKDKLDFKTDADGCFKGSYILNHQTQTGDKIVFYILVENIDSPVSFIVNGEESEYHIIHVLKLGEVTFDFELSNLPIGKHIIHLINEPCFEYVEQVQECNPSIKYIYTRIYFSLEVTNGKMPLEHKKYEIMHEQRESDFKNRISLKLFEDKKLSIVAEQIKDGSYYLTINNDKDYEIKGQLCLMSDYRLESTQKLIVREKTKVIVPVKFHRETLKKSIRFIFLMTPTKIEAEAGVPIRGVFMSERLLLQDEVLKKQSHNNY
ncbi:MULTISPECIES: hypothetical protein [unclassified Viridibacillus]|uniref:hypothetical protein n=1 Tax=unclassified Viridibacillus TaxID=2617942 RepID=UPI00096CBA4B|nr:hypothetical protein [Viridibacillus sp. FSL H8-0123]OMC79297.1 hypothetical protein BK130_19125 [Viridibacillus sp. FSL H8-0123]